MACKSIQLSTLLSIRIPLIKKKQHTYFFGYGDHTSFVHISKVASQLESREHVGAAAGDCIDGVLATEAGTVAPTTSLAALGAKLSAGRAAPLTTS